jgi:hypothetical protein
MKSYSTIHSQEISTIYREKWSGTSVKKYGHPLTNCVFKVPLAVI